MLPGQVTRAVGAFVFCMSAQASAGICEAEQRQLMAAYPGETRITAPEGKVSDILYKVRTASDFRTCEEAGVDPSLLTRCKAFTKGVDPASPQYYDALMLTAQIYQGFSQAPSVRNSPERFVYLVNACVARHMASQIRTAPASTAGNPVRQPSPNSASAPDAQRRSQNPLEDDAFVLSAAVTYAKKRQAEVDRAREGKPKRHKSGAEAHNCLKPQPGGGVVNNCPFAVEYQYCVYHPTKDSWSASFDCEKTGGGSWQIGPGPNSRSIMHTAGEMTYWFACRYGETLSKPEGISPVDVEFQRGRGLVGRCGEWGSSRG